MAFLHRNLLTAVKLLTRDCVFKGSRTFSVSSAVFSKDKDSDSRRQPGVYDTKDVGKMLKEEFGR